MSSWRESALLRRYHVYMGKASGTTDKNTCLSPILWYIFSELRLYFLDEIAYNEPQ